MHTRSSRRALRALTASVAVAAGLGGVATAAGGGSQADISAFFDGTYPEVVVDDSVNCAGVDHEPVVYRHDRIVLRTARSNANAATLVTARLNALYGTAAASWVSAVERIVFPTPVGDPLLLPVLSLSLSPRPGGQVHDVLGLARSLRADPGIETSPDYVLSPAGPYSFFWPNGYPTPTNELTPPRANLTPGGQPIGTGVKVSVFDTGLAPGDPALLPQTTTWTPADDEIVDDPNDADIRVDYPYAGHGRAIAGVLATVAPGAVVEEIRISDRNGLATDVSAARRTAASMRNRPVGEWPDVLVDSFGTSTCLVNAASPADQLEPVGLRAVAEAIERWDSRRADGMVVVAAAGNVASDRPHYPAAFDTVIGVGALDGTIDSDASPWSIPARTAAAAEFSNHGWWVDAWVPGVDLPTTHVSGVTFEDGGAVVMGKAIVDGTSFAAPSLAATIAEVMSTTGADARDAWTQIEATGAEPLPPCGSGAGWSTEGVAVALTSLSASATDPGTELPAAC